MSTSTDIEQFADHVRAILTAYTTGVAWEVTPSGDGAKLLLTLAEPLLPVTVTLRPTDGLRSNPAVLTSVVLSLAQEAISRAVVKTFMRIPPY